MIETEFRKRMQDRLSRWYGAGPKNPDPALQKEMRRVAGLVNKTLMFDFAQKLDIPLP